MSGCQLHYVRDDLFLKGHCIMRVYSKKSPFNIVRHPHRSPRRQSQIRVGTVALKWDIARRLSSGRWRRSLTRPQSSCCSEKPTSTSPCPHSGSPRYGHVVFLRCICSCGVSACAAVAVVSFAFMSEMMPTAMCPHTGYCKQYCIRGRCRGCGRRGGFGASRTPHHRAHRRQRCRPAARRAWRNVHGRCRTVAHAAAMPARPVCMHVCALGAVLG